MPVRVVLYEDIGWLPAFYVYGLEQLAARGDIELRRRPGIIAPVSAEQRKWKSVLLDVSDRGRERRLYIDMFDSAESLNLDVAAKVDRYFKVQYRRSAVAAKASAFAHKIAPTGFHFPVRLTAGGRLRMLRRLRAAALSSRQPTPRSLYQTFRYAMQSYERERDVLPAYEEYTRTLADDPVRENDLFWNVNWWAPEVDPEGASASRLAIMKVLDAVNASGEFRLTYGFIDSEGARKHVPDHVLRPTPSTKEYVRLVARAKLSIVPLGVQRCFSHRVAEHLALRRFALMERFANEVAVPLEDGRHTVFYDPDLSDLADKLRYYLRHDTERERIAAEGRRYFDEHCSPETQVRRMIDDTLA